MQSGGKNKSLIWAPAPDFLGILAIISDTFFPPTSARPPHESEIVELCHLVLHDGRAVS